MTKKTATPNIDPLAAVRAAMVEGVDVMTTNNAKFVELAQAEIAKAKATATANAEKTQAAVQANIDAAVASGEIVAAGIEQAGALVEGELPKLVEARIAAFKQVIGATTPKDAIDAQIAFVAAEQARAQAFVEAFVTLGRTVANDALKPVQAQAAENLAAINVQAA